MNEALNELIENFNLLEDWEDRYAYLIDLGKSLEGLPDTDKIEENRVRGCTSQVWLTHEWRDTSPATLQLYADSDAFIVRGLVALLLTTYNHLNAQEVLAFDVEGLFKQLGLERHLSFSRRNGFFSMVQRVKSLASTQHDAHP